MDDTPLKPIQDIFETSSNQAIPVELPENLDNEENSDEKILDSLTPDNILSDNIKLPLKSDSQENSSRVHWNIENEQSSKKEEEISQEEETEQEDGPFSQDIIEKAIQALLHGKEISLKKYPQVLQELQVRLDVALEKPDYDLATQLEDALKRGKLQYKQLTLKSVQDQKTAKLKEKLKQAQDKLSKMQTQFSNTKKQFDASAQEKRQKLEEKHQQEMDKLLDYYESGIPPKFRKFSRELLELKKREQTLKQGHRYQEAKGIKEEADALEAYENELIKIKWNHQRDRAISELQKKQDLEMNGLIQRQERQWQEVIPDEQQNESNLQKVVDKRYNILRMVQIKEGMNSKSLPNYKTKRNNFSQTLKPKRVITQAQTPSSTSSSWNAKRIAIVQPIPQKAKSSNLT